MLYFDHVLFAPGIPLWIEARESFAGKNPPVVMLICKRTCIALHTSADAFTDSPQLAEKYDGFKGDNFGFGDAFDTPDDLSDIMDEFPDDMNESAGNVDDFPSFEGCHRRMEEFQIWLATAEPLEQVMRDIHFAAAHVKPTLQHFLCPDKLSFVVKGISEKLIAEPTDVHNLPPDVSGVSLAPEKYAGLVVFSPAELEVDDETTLEGGVRSTRVIMPDGTIAWFKKYDSHKFEHIEREIDSFNKIKTASFQDEDAVRTPKLLGVVQGTAKDQVYGLLLTSIDPGPRSEEADREVRVIMRLSNRVHFNLDVDTSLREKWKRQITHTLLKLHAAGVLWKDPEPHNILIDCHDDAWIVSFGSDGEFSRWMPEELVGTVEGDLHALGLICRFIDGDDRNDLMHDY